MSNLIFPKGFLWGAATSDYQIEGASNIDGKGETFWDRFCSIPGKVANDDNGNTACDHYHRYVEDVELMKEIGLAAYRMSISWARIFPEGKGRPNPKGMDFYKRLIDLLLQSGIKPVVTLQHWGFPQKLQDQGGWANRDIAEYFQQFVYYVFKELGDVVHTWITHNEPIETSYLGYFTGEHAPGCTDFPTSLLVTHNLLISHGKAVETFRQMGLEGEIGITLDFHPGCSLSNKVEDIAAADRIGKYFNRWFAEAIFKGKFPDGLEEFFLRKGVKVPEMSREDFKLVSLPIDFLGVNYYFPYYVKHNPSIWPFECDTYAGTKGKAKTSMGWAVFPDGMYDTVKKLVEEYGNIKMYITENGAAFDDIVDRTGKVEDPQRIDFLYQHLEQVHRCIQEGINLQGYFVWSLMDNFEWAWGYDKRFGIIHIDYETMKRTVKSSGYWYRDVIKRNGLM